MFPTLAGARLSRWPAAPVPSGQASQRPTGCRPRRTAVRVVPRHPVLDQAVLRVLALGRESCGWRQGFRYPPATAMSLEWSGGLYRPWRQGPPVIGGGIMTILDVVAACTTTRGRAGG